MIRNCPTSPLIGNGGKKNMKLLKKLRYKFCLYYKVKLSVYRYAIEIKKPNKAFIINQNYSTTYYTPSTFWRILTGNGGKQDIKFMRKKLHYFDTFDISMA